MAGFKAVAGQCAIFWVVPICGGVLVFATYAIGRRHRPADRRPRRRVDRRDEPDAAVHADGADERRAGGGGVGRVGRVRARRDAAGRASRRASRPQSAILIRPNLAPLARRRSSVWWSGAAWREPRVAQTPSQTASRAVGSCCRRRPARSRSPSINARLYGSPLASGYDLTDGFLLSYVVPNLRRYGWWLISAETPFALAGLAGLAIPSARLWRTRASREARWLLGGVAADRLDLVSAVRAVGRLVVPPVPAAGVADDGARHGVARGRRSIARPRRRARRRRRCVARGDRRQRRRAGGRSATRSPSRAAKRSTSRSRRPSSRSPIRTR